MKIELIIAIVAYAVYAVLATMFCIDVAYNNQDLMERLSNNKEFMKGFTHAD